MSNHSPWRPMVRERSMRSGKGVMSGSVVPAVVLVLLSYSAPASALQNQDFIPFDQLMNSLPTRDPEIPAEPAKPASATRRSQKQLSLPNQNLTTPVDLNRTDRQFRMIDESFPPAKVEAERERPAIRFPEFSAPANSVEPPNPFAPASQPRYQFQPEFDPSDDRSRFGTNSEMQVDEETEYIPPEFDWSRQSTSIADLRFPTATVFAHDDAFLTTEEEKAYLDLVNTIERQRLLLLQQTTSERASSSKPVSVWEESFYQFTNARRLAWDNGHLRKEIKTELPGGLPDPFRDQEVFVNPMNLQADAKYSPVDDISRFPQDFVGRPIVLYGRLSASSTVRISDDPRTATSAGRGARRDYTELKLMRGTLTAIGSDRQIATIDTQKILTPQRGAFDASEWNEGPIPVLVKGWVVKGWNGKPLVYSESVRQLSPIPHFELVRSNTVDKRRLRDEEKWLYYETLQQMELTSPEIQKQVAANVLGQRIDDLMLEVNRKSATDLEKLAEKLKAGSIDEAKYRQARVSLQRRQVQRVDRYRKLRKTPEKFQTFVDVFQHPDVWHGHLVTLKGHIRHVVSYPSDETLFGGRMLHELWLFTDDSQHNPAVIVTPNLPRDFPKDADVVDLVSVTGCFFKRYVYGSQDTDRIAPLLLAGRIDWVPTVAQVERLVKDGHMQKGSTRAQKASLLAAQEPGDTAMTLICLFIILLLMVLWGRAQREERDRIRLRKRVDEVPEFESSPLLGRQGPNYTAGFTEYDFDAADDTRRTF